jgi:hypothetical protein
MNKHRNGSVTQSDESDSSFYSADLSPFRRETTSVAHTRGETNDVRTVLSPEKTSMIDLTNDALSQARTIIPTSQLPMLTSSAS